MAQQTLQQYYEEKKIDARPMSEPYCPYDNSVLTIKISTDKDGKLVGGNYMYPFKHTIWKCTKCKAEFIDLIKEGSQ